MIDEESYKNSGTTIQMCRNNKKAKITARGFPKNQGATIWEGVDSSRTNFAWIDLSQVTDTSGRLVKATGTRTVKMKGNKTRTETITFDLRIIIYDLDKLEYQNSTDWVELPSSIAGICDQTVFNIRAIPAPPGVQWNIEQVKWVGKVNGTGINKTVVPSLSLNDFTDTISVSTCNTTITSVLSLQGVAFTPSPNQGYEYDDNRITFYSSYQTTPIPGIPWKYIPTQNSDVITATQ